MAKVYLALLRGINVGGSNVVKMTDLKACFEQAGFERITTVIQSGNVLFGASDSNLPRVTAAVETALSRHLGHEVKTVVISYPQLKYIVDNAPRGFGKRPDAFRYDVIFLRPPLEGNDVVKLVPTREGVDQAFAGKGVVYFSRLIAKVTQSRLSKLVSLPVYKELTIRNWNTTTRLLRLMDAG